MFLLSFPSAKALSQLSGCTVGVGMAEGGHGKT